MGVANEDIVYQKARGRARGKPKFFEKIFRRPSARRGEARPGRARAAPERTARNVSTQRCVSICRYLSQTISMQSP